jgi:hypothetical protein
MFDQDRMGGVRVGPTVRSRSDGGGGGSEPFDLNRTEGRSEGV